ncbi:hypothetical protein NQ317_007819 [Molorchus minor]|uniref:Uncharacterized protein n=1 Tax=Molorchus minor TaxID=1323400 RepID=A0ABQ9K5Z9_9CUCU|nr:hypothetical protein NQ317_007819 [Molorchus minor]
MAYMQDISYRPTMLEVPPNQAAVIFLGSTGASNVDAAFRLSSSDILKTPRDRKETNVVLGPRQKKTTAKKDGSRKSSAMTFPPSTKASSSIPLPVKSPKSSSPTKVAKTCILLFMLLQDQLKHKETQWSKEKEELTKNLKHQENLLQKMNADKNKFETREQLDITTKEKEEATVRCQEMEDYISKMGLDQRETMHMVSSSIEWGKECSANVSEAQKYSQSLVKDIMIRECQDKIKQLERENNFHKEAIAMVENTKQEIPTVTETAVLMQHDIVGRYKQLLAESEQKLTEKSHEVAKLTAEIRQLKVRQEHLEELNLKCPTENLQKMVEEGRQKLSELMKKSLESEQKLLHYESVIEKQRKQMHEMENLLRYRENMAGVLKASRDELVLEKESLTRYAHEMRLILKEIKQSLLHVNKEVV